MDTTPDPAKLGRIRDSLEHRLPDFLVDLETLVTIESGSHTKAGVDAVARWMADRLAVLGASLEWHRHATLGDTLVATFDGGTQGPAVLITGHTDTVFEPGFLAQRPFEVDGARAFGPGVSDMKSGLLCGLYALETLRALGSAADWLPVGRLVYVVNPDEELGSPVSTPIIEQIARSADAALVLESARANGDIVSARKGLLHVRATLHGRAAHAGVEPEKGRSATLEAAHKTVALHALNGRWPSVTVNVGAINGGTRPNIVADECVLAIDVRARTATELDEARAAVHAILGASTVPDIEPEIEELALWRPMERTEASARLVDAAVAIAAELGFELRETATGGGSDANTTSGAGAPSLDGLGPIGGNDHTADEYIEIGSIVPRTTLLAGLLLSLGGPTPSVDRRRVSEGT